jgi:hypothetical protein
MRYRNRLIKDCEEGYIICAICGLPINLSLNYPNPWSLTIDHIRPIVKGGATREDNLQPAHFRCNRRKGERLGLDLDEINRLREEQGAAPKSVVKTFDLGYIKKFPPSEWSKPSLQADIERAKRGLPQSANWRTY